MNITVNQPNETNSTLSEAIAYWSDRHYRMTMFWGRERVSNTWSQISSKFAAMSDLYLNYRNEAQSELTRLIALKPYVSPLMVYTALMIALSVVCKPTITHSRKMPVTTVYPIPGQQRVIVYKVVKIAKVSIGTLLGLRYGFIRLNGDKRVVKSKMQVNGSWSQWEML